MRRATGLAVSPGLRTGWHAGDTQTIVGMAVPMSLSDGAGSAGVFGYVSYELPFTRRP